MNPETFGDFIRLRSAFYEHIVLVPKIENKDDHDQRKVWLKLTRLFQKHQRQTLFSSYITISTNNDYNDTSIYDRRKKIHVYHPLFRTVLLRRANIVLPKFYTPDPLPLWTGIGYINERSSLFVVVPIKWLWCVSSIWTTH